MLLIEGQLLLTHHPSSSGGGLQNYNDGDDKKKKLTPLLHIISLKRMCKWMKGGHPFSEIQDINQDFGTFGAPTLDLTQ